MAASTIRTAAAAATAALDTTTPAQQHLAQLLSKDTDVRLQFGTDMVPAHGIVLSLASKVLANAVAAGGPIPMAETSKDDWMLVMLFIYPVVGAPEVSYDNLEVLLKIAMMYDMPALLDRVNRFLIQQAEDRCMSTNPKDQEFVLKWAKAADAAGLAEAVKACLDAAVQLNGCNCYPGAGSYAGAGSTSSGIDAAFSNKTLQGLSLDSIVYLVRRLAEQGKGTENGYGGYDGNYGGYDGN